MASVESEAGYFAAVGEGWRTYRARLPDMPLLSGERDCMSTLGVQCESCRGCGGAAVNRPNYSIVAHGGVDAMRNVKKLLQKEGERVF